MKRTKEQTEEGERLQKQKGRAATVTRTMNMKPTRQRQKVELFEPHQSAKRARPSPPPKKKKPLNVDVGKLAAALRAFLTGEGDEFENLVSAVVEVDKILAVKSNSKGGLLYQILWVDGTKTWEPEDNVMDDDLVDAFEAAEQAKAYAEDDIKVGSEVEVKNVEEGFENSWAEATVTKTEPDGRVAVEYSGFVSEDGGAVSETVERKRLRLVPEAAVKGWEPVVGEIIEVNEDDCWWEARVIEITGKKAKLQLRVSDEFKMMSLGTKKLRPCSWLTMANKKAK